MSQELVPSFADATIPAALVPTMNSEQDKQETSGGVQASFAVLSVRGSNWRLKYKSQEHLLQDAEGNPKSYIDVVLVKASPNLSKIFYAKAYAEGDDQTPDCYSLDGIKPDIGSMKKQAESCAVCPNNVWGSKITPTGSKTKACADARRVACVSSADVKSESTGGPMLLRVPPASLAELANYGDRLRANGWPYYGLVTRVSFDTEASFPKLVFKEIRPLTEEEAQTVVEHRGGDEVQRILNEIAGAEPDSADGVAPETSAAAAAAEAVVAAPAPALAVVPDTPPPAEPAAPTPFADEAAAAPAKPAKAAKAAKAAPAEAAPAAEPEKTPDDVDAMIKNLLG